MDGAETLAEMMLPEDYYARRNPFTAPQHFPAPRPGPFAPLSVRLVAVTFAVAHLHTVAYCWMRGIFRLDHDAAALGVSALHGVSMVLMPAAALVDRASVPSRENIVFYALGYAIYLAASSACSPTKAGRAIRFLALAYLEAITLAMFMMVDGGA